MRQPVFRPDLSLLKINLLPKSAARDRLSDWTFITILVLQPLLSGGVALLASAWLSFDLQRVQQATRQATQAQMKLPAPPPALAGQTPQTAGVESLEAWLAESDPATVLFERLLRLTPDGVVLSAYRQNDRDSRLDGMAGSAQALHSLELGLRSFKIIRKEASATHAALLPAIGFSFWLAQPLAPATPGADDQP